MNGFDSERCEIMFISLQVFVLPLHSHLLILDLLVLDLFGLVEIGVFYYLYFDPMEDIKSPSTFIVGEPVYPP